jgi:hypothetical protein
MNSGGDRITRWAGIAGLAITAGTMVWQMSGIAHDVQEVKEAVGDMRADGKETDGRLNALDSRVTRLEASVSLLENNHGKAPSPPS